MQSYNEYKFLFPPRALHKISLGAIHNYDTGDYLAQPKYNGSASILFMNSKGFMKLMNRHGEELSLVKKDLIDFGGAYRGEGFFVLCGELLNKNKKGEDGAPFNQKFIIWDILVFNGMYLTGITCEERMALLEHLFPCTRLQVGTGGAMEMYNHVCCTGIKGIYKAPVYLSGFEKLYLELIKTDVYEGLVLKRRSAPLALGYNEKNNTDSMIKIRKETKNYSI